ncbi:MAG: WD40/YVTN/BNR-like repeat-containing protein, partial [Bacteroidia bacterium]
MKKSLLIVASALTLNAFPQATPSPSWTAENSNFPNVSTGVKYMDAVNANVVWAIGYDGTAPNRNTNVFTRTINGGTTFTPGTIWPDTNTYFPGSLEGIDANTAFVSAYLRATQDRGNVFKTTNGGATWTNMNAANMFTVAGTSFLDFVAFTTPSVGIALGDPAPANDFEIYRTTDGGASWTQVPGANIPNAASGEYGLVNVYTKTANHIWFGTNKNRIYHSADGGQTWSVSATITGTVPLTTTGTGVSDIAFRDPNNGLALMYANSGVAYLYNTTDGGATWNNIPVIDPNMGLNDFCAIPGSNAYASGGAGTGNNVISYSTNDGVSWTDWGRINIQYLSIDFVDPLTGWAGAFS